MQVAIIKYNSGNICSVEYALQRLGVEPLITDNPEEIKKADRVIFPGVGHAAATMPYLKEHKLDKLIKDLKQPVLGICLGMQLMCARSEEGNVDGLGIFDDEVKRFICEDHQQFKIPHMGWNTLEQVKGTLFSTLPINPFVYFVHSYYVPVGVHTIATTHYIQPFSAALRKDNFWAAQFHPEKSGEHGASILKQFLKESEKI